MSRHQVVSKVRDCRKSVTSHQLHVLGFDSAQDEPGEEKYQHLERRGTEAPRDTVKLKANGGNADGPQSDA